MLPSPERLAGSGLTFAVLTIGALSGLALVELDRETELHREMIASLQVKDSLVTLGTQMASLAHAARIAALARDAGAAQEIERRAVEIDAELDYLAQNPAREDLPAFVELNRAARLLGVNARSVAAARGSAPAPGASAQAEHVNAEATAALERMLESQGAGINNRILAQLRVSETLRTYVSWLLAGSALVLLGLFAFYRWAKARERMNAQRIERLAHYDTVTGLPNRALLAELLEREVARARRSERGFALLMFDLDGFKQVNDTWGHAAGDKVLEIVGERSRSGVRASDIVGRMGGDEFLAILPEATRDGALQVAEKLRESLALPYPLGQQSADLSASIGVSFFGAHGTEAEALQRAADMALYEAKRRGRNRVLEAA